MNNRFLTKIELLLIVFKESFVAVVPYLFLSSFSTLSYVLVEIFEIQLGIINLENTQNIALIINKFFSLILLVSLTYHFAKRLNTNHILSICLSVLIYITVETLAHPAEKLDFIFSSRLFFLVLIIPLSSVVSLNILTTKVRHPLNDAHLSNVFKSIAPSLVIYFLSVALYTQAIELALGFNGITIENLLHYNDKTLLIIRTVMNSLFWFVGLHGNYVLDVVFGINFLDHEIFKNISYRQFFDLFATYGGAGSGLSLIIAILLSAKDTQSKYIAKLALPFAIFNINEILIFGIPIIFNRHLIIPFILVPLTSVILSYGAFYIHPVAFTEHTVSWITPAFISAYIATDGNLFAIALQACSITLGVFIYMPFVRKYTATQSSAVQLKTLAEKLDITTSLEAGEGLAAYKAETSIINSNYQLQKIINFLHNNNLKIYYQPKINIKNNTCNHYEALLRLEMTDGRIVGPYFIKNIEDTGLSPILDLWVCRKVNSDIEKWLSNGFKPQISINLHPDTLSNNEAINQIIATSAGNNIDFELIERSLLDSDVAEKNLRLLIKNGFPLSIDDFGVGYSNLNILVKLPFSFLKFDKSLIDFIHTDQGYSICKYFAGMCNEVGVIAVAEGVETKEQLALVRKIGIPYVQGYYYSPALEFEKVKSWESSWYEVKD